MAEQIVQDALYPTGFEEHIDAAEILKAKLETFTEITTAEQKEVHTEIIAQVKKLIKAVEVTRTAKVKPMNDKVKGINQDVKDAFTTDLKAVETKYTNEVLRYEQEMDRKTKEAIEALDPEIQAHVAQSTGAKKATTGTLGSKTSYVKYWTYEVKAKSKLPVKYLKDDPVAINKAIADGVRDIPGLRIYEDERLASHSS